MIGVGMAGITVIVQAGQAHHDARCTKTALRAMGLGHGLLNRVGLGVSQVLNGEHLGAVDNPQGHNTCVDRLVVDFRILKTTQQHRACPAVAFSAAFLGAGQTFFKAQKVQQGLVWVE